MNTLEWIILGLQFVILGFVFQVWVSVNNLSVGLGRMITDGLFVVGVLLFLVPVGLFAYNRFIAPQPRQRY